MTISFITLPLCAAIGFDDDIDRTDPNFVKASLLIFGPGEELYSCAGHACFRLECKEFNLDYCFSYESEAVNNRVMAFLAGNLKMGMFAIPVAEFLRTYREDGRGVLQYELNLPPDVKQRLWKLLDEKVAEGVNLQYDFIERGCAQSTLRYLLKAIAPTPIEYSPWPVKYDKTLRELFEAALVESPWNLCILEALVGIDVDAEMPKIRRVIIPTDLVEFLKSTKICGKAIITREPIELLSITHEHSVSWLSPIVVATFIVALAILYYFTRIPCLGYLFLAFQTLMGILLTYLIFISTLPATTWNWLIIPFNIFPIVFWKWRKKWAIPFVVILLVWEAFMLFSPHRLTDPAFYILVVAYIIFYLRVAIPPRASFIRGNHA